MGEYHCFLLDLERTLLSGAPCYWKGNKHGYTYKIENAGIFRKDIAEEIVKNDFDKKTVAISVKTMSDIFGKDFIAYERT